MRRPQTNGQNWQIWMDASEGGLVSDTKTNRAAFVLETWVTIVIQVAWRSSSSHRASLVKGILVSSLPIYCLANSSRTIWCLVRFCMRRQTNCFDRSLSLSSPPSLWPWKIVPGLDFLLNRNFASEQSGELLHMIEPNATQLFLVIRPNGPKRRRLVGESRWILSIEKSVSLIGKLTTISTRRSGTIEKFGHKFNFRAWLRSPA